MCAHIFDYYSNTPQVQKGNKWKSFIKWPLQCVRNRLFGMSTYVCACIKWMADIKMAYRYRHITTTNVMFGHFTSSHFDSASILSTHESISPVFSLSSSNCFRFLPLYFCVVHTLHHRRTNDRHFQYKSDNSSIVAPQQYRHTKCTKTLFNKGSTHVCMWQYSMGWNQKIADIIELLMLLKWHLRQNICLRKIQNERHYKHSDRKNEKSTDMSDSAVVNKRVPKSYAKRLHNFIDCASIGI